jgi:2',3'-cyclic-nucleotide 2'-phosphodiesterase/3'-nucleotidase/5'-nucleotidase
MTSCTVSIPRCRVDCYAIDRAGNTRVATSVTVIDKTAPVKPVINQVKDYDKKVTVKK